MDVISRLTLLGGACHRSVLLATHSRKEVDQALARGDLIRTGRGRYALGTARDFVITASRVRGIASHRSAALLHGWSLPRIPPLPDVTVPRHRRLRNGERGLVLPHWSDLADHDVDGIVTNRRRTLVDCMRNLPVHDSLPIVDEAIRCDDFTHREVMEIARSTQGRGRARIMAVATEATSKAANEFESLLRAHAGRVPGLAVVAQYPISVPGTWVTLHPDLADPRLKLAIEAESFEWHGKSAQLTRDCWRYNTLTLLGWVVIRFSWYQVHHEPAYVYETLLRAVEFARGAANVA